MSRIKFRGVLFTPAKKILGSGELTGWKLVPIRSEKALHEHFNSLDATYYDFFLNKDNTDSEVKILQRIGIRLEVITLIGYKEVVGYFRENPNCFVFFK